MILPFTHYKGGEFIYFKKLISDVQFAKYYFRCFPYIEISICLTRNFKGGACFPVLFNMYHNLYCKTLLQY